MCTEKLRNLAAFLAAFLLVTVPVAASAGREAARTAVTADSVMPAMLVAEDGAALSRNLAAAE